MRIPVIASVSEAIPSTDDEMRRAEGGGQKADDGERKAERGRRTPGPNNRNVVGTGGRIVENRERRADPNSDVWYRWHPCCLL